MKVKTGGVTISINTHNRKAIIIDVDININK